MSTCPKCQQTLVQIDYKNIELLQCSDCQGFWFKDGQFREVKQFGFSGLPGTTPSQLESEDSATSPSTSSQELACPDCQDQPLVPYTYAYSSDIQLYRCAHCRGIWADYTELLRIEELLSIYQESLEEAKAKALPLMLKVKNQIQKEEEQQQKKKGVLNRIFGSKSFKNRKIQNVFEEDDRDEDEQV